MPTNPYRGLPYDKFAMLARKAVVDSWNSDKKLVHQFGTIDIKQVFIVWQVKAIQNSKALLGVSMDGDGMYYEATWSGNTQQLYLDVYKKEAHDTYKMRTSGARVEAERVNTKESA